MNEQYDYGYGMERNNPQSVKARTGLATASLVFGILALVTTLFLINYIFGILAIVFGVIYLAKKADIKPKGKAIAGLVCAGLSLVISTTIWVSAYVYIVNTNMTDIIEDVAGLMGEEVDGRELMNDMVLEMTGNRMSLDTIEEFVGGEISVERLIDFVGDVKEQEITDFIEMMETVDYSKLAEEFSGGVTYEALEEKLGEDFSLRELMEYIEENTTLIEQ